MSDPLKLLLVEDHEYSREAMAMYLERDFQVLEASNGVEALEILRNEPDLQLMLTDWMMPRMDGLELCRLARTLTRDRYLHIIVFTARTQREDLLAALQAGGDAFVGKPVDPAELQAQLQVALRIMDLQEQAARRMEELVVARQVVDSDLEAAARIQRSLLPQTPPSAPGLRFAWALESSSHIGGDMFDVVDLGGGRIGVYVLDVCGSGAQAALLAVSIGWVLSSRGLLCTAEEGGDSHPTPPAEVAREMNRRFPVLGRSDQYFTLLYGVIDMTARTFDFVRAGQPPPLLLSDPPRDLPAGRAGPPLGVLSEADYLVGQERHALRAGDLWLLYTDGLLRALGEGDRPAREEELRDLVRPFRPRGARGVVGALREMVHASRPDGLEDDAALVAFEVLDAESGRGGNDVEEEPLERAGAA